MRETTREKVWKESMGESKGDKREKMLEGGSADLLVSLSMGVRVSE